MAWKRSNLLSVFLITLVVLGVLLEEVEGRRKILRGRKTITRTYYKSLGLPSWFVLLLVHGGLLLAGGISYAILHSLLITRNKVPSYMPRSGMLASQSQETQRLEAEEPSVRYMPNVPSYMPKSGASQPQERQRLEAEV
uniref:Uncharacterized protein n=1 Tax=Cacopsylla melanoneura TaxID=428564 RepID=A0A8D8RVK6_9HEMI